MRWRGRVARAIGAENVSIWLIDYGHAWLMPDIDPGRPQLAGQAEALAVATTAAGRVFARADPIESDEPSPHRWVPLLDGTERLGVLRFDFPQPLSDAQRHACDVIASLVGELLVSKRVDTDLYDIQRRRGGMSLAAEMQWQLLPALTVATPRVAVAGVLEPAYSVGGDAFDYAINSDVAHVAIVDSMGHGLDASQMAAVAIGSYRHSRRQRYGLVDTHRALDDVLSRQFGDDRFATAQLAELDLGTGELRLLNAGHPAPLHVARDGSSRPVPCSPALPVGLGPDGTPPVATMPLEPGDRLLFFTDGVVENRRPDGEPFGEERLREAFAGECAAGHTASETVRRLGYTVIDHAAHELTDDATMVLVEWRDIPSRPPARP